MNHLFYCLGRRYLNVFKHNEGRSCCAFRCPFWKEGAVQCTFMSVGVCLSIFTYSITWPEGIEITCDSTAHAPGHCITWSSLRLTKISRNLLESTETKFTCQRSWQPKNDNVCCPNVVIWGIFPPHRHCGPRWGEQIRAGNACTYWSNFSHPFRG